MIQKVSVVGLLLSGGPENGTSFIVRAMSFDRVCAIARKTKKASDG